MTCGTLEVSLLLAVFNAQSQTVHFVQDFQGGLVGEDILSAESHRLFQRDDAGSFNVFSHESFARVQYVEDAEHGLAHGFTLDCELLLSATEEPFPRSQVPSVDCDVDGVEAEESVGLIATLGPEIHGVGTDQGVLLARLFHQPVSTR